MLDDAFEGSVGVLMDGEREHDRIFAAGLRRLGRGVSLAWRPARGRPPSVIERLPDGGAQIAVGVYETLGAALLQRGGGASRRTPRLATRTSRHKTIRCSQRPWRRSRLDRPVGGAVDPAVLRDPRLLEIGRVTSMVSVASLEKMYASIAAVRCR